MDIATSGLGEAEASCRQAIELSSDYAEAHNNLDIKSDSPLGNSGSPLNCVASVGFVELAR